MSNLFTTVKEKVQGKGISIVLPEGTDERILGARAFSKRRVSKTNLSW